VKQQLFSTVSEPAIVICTVCADFGQSLCTHMLLRHFSLQALYYSHFLHFGPVMA
jgi:hypothetical protein